MPPRRPRTHQIGDLAVNRLCDFFLAAGWTAENLDQDYGEDIFVRIFENEEATPYSFFVQSKSTDNLSRYTTADRQYARYPFESSRLRYWNDFWEPVIITLWDPKADTIYWEVAQSPEVSPNLDSENSSILIPFSNVLNEANIARLKGIAVARHDRFHREQVGAQVLVEYLEEMMGVKIDYNPQLGILIVENPKDGMTIQVFGPMAERIDRHAKINNITTQESMDAAFKVSLEKFSDLQAGKQVPRMDKEGNEIGSWESLEELLRHLKNVMDVEEEPWK